MTAVAEDGTNWVPYLENGQNQADTAKADTAKTSTNADHAAMSQRSATQSLIEKAQTRAAMNDQAMAR